MSPSHSAAVHNLHNNNNNNNNDDDNNNNNRFVGTRIKDDVEKMKTIRDYEMICMLLQYQGAPQIAIDKFGGNSLDYQYYKSMFNTVTKKKASDQKRRLTRQLKFTDGEAKESIKLCIHLPI